LRHGVRRLIIKRAARKRVNRGDRYRSWQAVGLQYSGCLVDRKRSAINIYRRRSNSGRKSACNVSTRVSLCLQQSQFASLSMIVNCII